MGGRDEREGEVRFSGPVGRKVGETGLELVEVTSEDRSELETGFWTQGRHPMEAQRIAMSVPSTDAALQMVARVRIKAERRVRVVTSPRFYSEADRLRAAAAIYRCGPSPLECEAIVDTVAEMLGMRRAGA